jgi:ferrous-iron efflux pump FieF
MTDRDARAGGDAGGDAVRGDGDDDGGGALDHQHAALGPAEAVGADAMRQTSRAAVVVALALIAMKAAAWWLTGSVGVLASLADSGLDLLASSINVWAIHHALEPPDREHRFGHGKLESLAGLAQALLVASSALFVLVQGAGRVVAPVAVEHGTVAVAVMIVSIAATLWLVRLQRRTIEASASVAIAADALHYEGDIAMNLGVLVGIGGAVLLDLAWLDGVVAVLVALWIVKSAWEIGATALEGLLDAEIEDSSRAAIIEVAGADPRVTGVHDLRTRRSGPFLYASLHIEVDGNLSLRAAHRIVADVERALRRAFPAGHFLLHVDPDDHEPEDPFGDIAAQAAGAATPATTAAPAEEPEP